MQSFYVYDANVAVIFTISSLILFGIDNARTISPEAFATQCLSDGYAIVDVVLLLYPDEAGTLPLPPLGPGT